jgi:fucose permease
VLSFSSVARPDEDEADNPRVLALLRRPLLIFSFLTLLLYVGTELGVSHWVAEYYERVLHAPEEAGRMMVSVLWAGVLVGRVAVSFGYRGTRQAEVLVVLACTCTAALAFTVATEDALLAGVGFFVAGLGFSAVYPLVMTLVGRHFRGGQSVALGFASTGGGVGAFAMPFVMAAISDHFGLRAGFVFYLLLCAMMTGVTFAILRLVRAAGQAARDKDERASSGKVSE